jgi:hypothetical protein
MKDAIKTYKNIFSNDDLNKIQEYFNSPNWSFGHYSEAHNKHKCFWNMNLSRIKYFNTDLYKIIQSLIPYNCLDIERIYANGQTYGLDGSFHIDNSSGYTFLYYANPEWEKEWGGNTVFYDSKTKEKIFIYPEPNSAVFFPGNILHYGQSPSRDFYGLRTTIAYKLHKSIIKFN